MEQGEAGHSVVESSVEVDPSAARLGQAKRGGAERFAAKPSGVQRGGKAERAWLIFRTLDPHSCRRMMNVHVLIVSNYMVLRVLGKQHRRVWC